MSKPGVLLVGNFLSARIGTRGVIEEMSQRLAEEGWLTVETSHQLSKPLRLADMLLTVLRHRRKYAVARVDVYSGLAFVWAECVTRLLKLIGKPVILSLHGGKLAEFAAEHPLRMKRLLRLGCVIVTPSLFLQHALLPYAANIRYLPNGVDVRHYEFRARTNPRGEIVWLRAFHAIYQPELAIKAVALLVREFRNIRLRMVGPDKEDGSLASARALVDLLDVRQHVHITGPVSKSEVPNALAGGDVFLNTTSYESFGVGVVEAALIGLPIVTTNVGELPYLWEHGTTAMLVPPDDPQAMAQAIRRVLSEDGLAERLSRNARRKAERFDWRVILPQWEAVFAEAMQSVKP